MPQAAIDNPFRDVPDNTPLLVAITQSRDMLDGKIGSMVSDVTLLCQDLRRAVERITETKTRISGVKDSVTALQQKLSTLMAMSKELVAQIPRFVSMLCTDLPTTLTCAPVLRVRLPFLDPNHTNES
ncbi:hypothetical protein NDU88_001571 [Pleurodeles waltl]|uniref:Uncharacterized protein n=1 Tax=Pleurodeles waltl TaxID=8319 RepID=A0AAV7W0W2_PLEWA|nr:hypothetical protein NDU88_001571 [Pleurodeles waltl]